MMRYSYKVTITDTEAFRRGLLLYLDCSTSSDGWELLSDSMAQGRNFAASRYDRDIDLSYATFKRAKTALLHEGLIEQSRVGKHFRLRLTPKGRLWCQSPDDDLVPLTVPEAPTAPYRVGSGHLLRPSAWKKLTASVQAGEVDLIVVPRATRTKVGYWDEQ